MEHNAISPEWLKSKGFVQVTKDNRNVIEGAWDLEINTQEDDLVYIENKCDRKQFAIVLTPTEDGDGSKYFLFEVFIRDDIGCGFKEIPNQFTEMTEYHFSLLFEAIRREKL